MATNLTLISRGYCHLCHEMESALQPLLERYQATMQVLDVDTDAELEARYDELVPVLLQGDGSTNIEICHYFLDTSAVRAYLEQV